MIDKNFIKNIPEDFNQAVEYFCSPFRMFDTTLHSGIDKLKKYDVYVKYYMALSAYIKSKGVEENPLMLTSNKSENIIQIRSYFNAWRVEVLKRLSANDPPRIGQRFY